MPWKGAGSRVGLLGPTQATAHWAAAVAGTGAQGVPLATVAEARGAGLDLLLVLGAAPDVADIAAELARTAPALPGVLLLAPEPERHPHLQLVQAILDAKRDWEVAFDTILDPVVLVNHDGRIARTNRALADLLREPVADVVGRHYRDVIGVLDGDPIAATLTDGQPRTVEGRPTGLPCTCQVSTARYAGDGGTHGAVVLLKDITAQREQQERLLQAVRLADVGQLAAGVAHEINTPLASIALRAESLQRAAQDPRLQEIDSFRNFPRYLKTIEEEIFRCKRIIGGLLDFARSRPPEIRELDVNAVAERAVDLLSHQMGLQQVGLAFEPDRSLAPIPADEGQVRQVVLALLMNALDATPPGGRVVVSTGQEGDRALLTVADTGSGIAAEHLDKIWSPFFTTKPPGRGTGLGLAICHGIVAAHGGEIRVHSEVGRGTRFTVVLPTRQGAARPAVPVPGNEEAR